VSSDLRNWNLLDRWLATLVELEQNYIMSFVVLIFALVLYRFLNRLFTPL
jgi:hypothetical protein